MTDVKLEIQAAVVDDVRKRLSQHPHYAAGKFGAGFNPVTAEVIERVVSAGLDTAINLFGGAGHAAADAAKPYIRKVVSEEAVEYLSSLLDRLKDAGPAAG
jgi:hypothetical protein